MPANRKPMCNRLLLICFVVKGAMLCFPVSSRAAAFPENASSDRVVYDANPDHLWNRLHGALFIRTGPDGHLYGHDRLEPLLWSHSMHLLNGNDHERAVAVLEEFLKSDGEKLIQDPLKRAHLQRDLWLVFNWLEGGHNTFALPLLTPEVVRAAVTQLRRPLAVLIRRLALTPQEIRSLPDNYQAALVSGQFARAFDPREPERPYLAPELFAADGPWVCVGRSDGLTAPRHLSEDGTNRFTKFGLPRLLAFAGRPGRHCRLFEALAFIRATTLCSQSRPLGSTLQIHSCQTQSCRSFQKGPSWHLSAG
jgi:hypothetical protein